MMRRPSVKTELLEIFGVVCLAAFAAFVWLPACLLVVGLAWFVAAYVAVPKGDS
jgi:hypothetical protein